MLDAYLVGCTERTTVYRQHAQFVSDYQFWGHWAHKRRDVQGRIYYLSPEVVLGNTQERRIDPGRLRRLFRLRQLTRLVRQPGHIRPHHFGLYIDPGLWGQTVEVLIYDDAVRIEQAAHLLVSYPCVYDPRQRRVTAVDAQGRQQYRQVQAIQLMLFTLGLVRSVWRMPLYRRVQRPQRALAALQPNLFDPLQIKRGSWPLLILMAKSEIHSIHVWCTVEHLVCQRAGRREHDVAISITFGEIESTGTSTRGMEGLSPWNCAVFPTLLWTGKHCEISKLPRFTKYGQEP
jgi:hypothetical protein